MYAWCLRTVGHVEPRQARDLARKCYPFEAPTQEYRGLVFHDEAWHWAMLQIIGEEYWQARPDLEHPSSEYQEASAEFVQVRGE